MRYPTAPHRPQAYRVRFVGRRRVHVHATSTWYGCLAALAVVATVAALATSAGIEGTKPTTMLAAPAAPPLAPGASGAAAGPSTPAAATGSRAHQGRQLDVQLTAYAASVEEGTAWGITRSGTRAVRRRGRRSGGHPPR